MQYTFRCQTCGQITVDEHGIGEPHPKYCAHRTERNHNGTKTMEVCAGKLVRVFDSPNVIYHGSGFFRTDKWQYEKPNNDIE